MQQSKVLSRWLVSGSRRLAARSYLSDFHQALITVMEFPGEKQTLMELARYGAKSIFNGPRFSRSYVTSEKNGVKLLSGRSVLQSDLSWAPLISKSKAELMPEMVISEGTILVTSYGTVGRVVYAGPALKNSFSSDNVLKIIPDFNKIPPGYLHSFLSSSIGNSLLVKEAAGGVVSFIDPKNVHNLLVPRIGNETESRIDRLIKDAYQLRSDFQKNIDAATELLFSSAGLSDITPAEWHSEGPDIGDQIYLKSPRSIRALNFGGRFKRLIENLKSVPHKTLGEICQGGQLSRGVRFKRIDSSPEYGAQLIGQKQGFWSKPEGRWISKAHAPEEIFSIDEAVLIASQGTLGEREVFCRPIFVTGKWLEYAYSEHFLRIYPNDTELSGAYVFAFLRSETAFRCLRSMSIGSKQQDIHVGMLSELPIPLIGHDDKKAVEQLIRDAFKAKDLADEYESTAIAMVESGIKAAAKKN